MSDSYSQQYFNVRGLNVLKLSTLTECEIARLEGEFACQRIAQQISEKYGDAEWKRDAQAAMVEIRHKLGLIAIKRAEIEARPSRSPEQTFAKKFVEAARAHLPPDQFHAIFQIAGALKATPAEEAA